MTTSDFLTRWVPFAWPQVVPYCFSIHTREVNRVLKPGGAIVWYDFIYNNPSNPHVRGISHTAIQKLFPQFRLILHKITLLPPLARRLGPFTPYLYPLLAAIPWFRTHYLGLLIKDGKSVLK